MDATLKDRKIKKQLPGKVLTRDPATTAPLFESSNFLQIFLPTKVRTQSGVAIWVTHWNLIRFIALSTRKKNLLRLWPKKSFFFSTIVARFFHQRQIRKPTYKDLISQVVLVAQGSKWSSCTPTLFDAQPLGHVANDYSCGFSDFC